VFIFIANSFIANNTILHNMYEDLRHNRLPPGIRLVALGNPNYPIGDVIDSVIDYFGYDVPFDVDQNIYIDDIVTVNRFTTGSNNIAKWLFATLTIGDGVVDALQLDKLILWPTPVSMNVTQLDGTRSQAWFTTSWLAPVLDFQFHIQNTVRGTRTVVELPENQNTKKMQIV